VAISSGYGPHHAELIVGGGSFPIEHGSVSQQAKRHSSSFSGSIPMSYPGAMETLADLGENEASISCTTRGQTATLVTGEIDAVSFDFIQRIIQFQGRDKSAKLHDMKTSEKFLNKKPSDIVTDLAGRVGLGGGSVSGGGAMAGKQLQQDYVHLTDNITLAYAIHKLAQFEGNKWWVDPTGNFHYVPMGTSVGSYSIMINQDMQPISSDCVELVVRRNVQAGKGITATVKSWHPKKKEVFSYTSNVSGSGSKPYTYNIPNSEMDHVTQHAKSRANELARHEFTVTATVVGDPSVMAGMELTLSGTDYFDQSFEMDTVQHDFGMSGHLTHITARSAKEGREAS
jgi:hypothetical protein